MDQEKFLSAPDARELVDLWFREEAERSCLSGDAVNRYGGKKVESYWFVHFCNPRAGRVTTVGKAEPFTAEDNISKSGDNRRSSFAKVPTAGYGNQSKTVSGFGRQSDAKGAWGVGQDPACAYVLQRGA